MDKHINYMEQAISLAVENAQTGGEPFAALVVDIKGNIIGTGKNEIKANYDPTAHAEVEAIRKACTNLRASVLTDCVLYTSCEPCPMCLGAIYWSQIQTVYYAADHSLAAAGGFDDGFIYQEINKPHDERKIMFQSLDMDDKNLPFETWIECKSQLES